MYIYIYIYSDIRFRMSLGPWFWHSDIRMSKSRTKSLPVSLEDEKTTATEDEKTNVGVTAADVCFSSHMAAQHAAERNIVGHSTFTQWLNYLPSQGASQIRWNTSVGALLGPSSGRTGHCRDFLCSNGKIPYGFDLFPQWTSVGGSRTCEKNIPHTEISTMLFHACIVNSWSCRQHCLPRPMHTTNSGSTIPKENDKSGGPTYVVQYLVPIHYLFRNI
jgi:hypothetical protein